MEADDALLSPGDLAAEPPGSGGWRVPAWLGVSLWSGTGALAIFLTGPVGFLSFVAVEAFTFLSVILLHGVRRWRTFLWLTPIGWFLSVPLLVGLTAGRRLGLAGFATILLAAQLPRLLACTVPMRSGERALLPPSGQLLALPLIGLGCGGLYAWLLTSGTIDAWDVDIRRQTIYQTGVVQVSWGLTAGLATLWAAVVASVLVQQRPERHPPRGAGRGWWSLTAALAAALVLAWATRLIAAISVQGMAVEGGFSAGLACWTITTPIAALAWVLHARTTRVPPP